MADTKLRAILEADNQMGGTLGDAQGSLSKLGSAAHGLGTAMKVGLAVGATAAIGAVAGLGAVLMSSVKEAMAAEVVTAQLNAVIASTGGVAGVTADAINAHALALSGVTRFEDDAIVAADALLLTFTKVGKDVFPQATEAILDLSTSMGMDLNSAAMMVGKALNDPVAGLTAMGKAGVTFTQAQKDMIAAMVEAGDMAGAQKLILAELETQVGGSAIAAGQTFAGQLDILKNALGNVKESIGGALIPALTTLATTLGPVLITAAQGFADWATTTLVPLLQTLFTWLATNLPLAIQTMSGIWATLQSSFATVQPIFQSIIAAGATLVTWLQADLPGAIATLQAQWEPVWLAISGAVSTAMEAIETIITQVISIVNGIIEDHKTKVSTVSATWEMIRGTVEGAVNAISDIINTVLGAISIFLSTHGEEIKTFLGGAWTQVEQIIGLAAELINATIVPIFQGIATFLSQHGAEIQAVLDTAWTAIKTVIQVALDLIQGIIRTALLIVHGDWSGAWEEIKATGERIWETINTAIGRIAADLGPILAAIWEDIKTAAAEKWEDIKTAIAEKWEAIKASIAEKIEAIKLSIITAWTNLKADIAQKWEDIKTAIADKIAEILTSVLTWLDNVFVAIENFDLRAAAETFFGTVIPGIIAKVNEALDNVATWLSDTWEKISTFDLKGAASTTFATVLSGLAAKITEALASVATWLSDTADKIAKFDFKAAALTLFHTVVAGIIEKAVTIISSVIQFLVDIYKKIEDHTFKSATMTAIQTVILGIIEKAVDILLAVGNFLKDIYTTIKEFSLKEAAWSLIEGFVQGILDSVDAVKDAIVSLIKAAIAAALAALNGGSPSRVFIAIGETIPQGLAIGILAGRGPVQGAMGTLVDDITGILDELEKYIKVIVAWLNTLAGYFANPGLGVGGAKAVVDALKPIFDGLADVLKGVQAVLTFELIADAAARVDAVIVFLRSAVPLLVAALVTVSSGISGPALTAARTMAVALGEIGKALVDMVSGFSAIAEYIPAGADVIDQFVTFIATDLARLVEALATAGSTFSTTALASAIAFAEAAGAVMAIIGDAIDAFAKLKDYDADFSLYAAGLWKLKEQIVNVTLWLARIAADFDAGAVPAVQAFAATAGAAMGVLSSAIDAFEKFQTFDADFNLYAAGLGRLKASILNVVQWLATIAADFDIEALPAVTAFSAAATAAMGVLSSAIDAFSKFQEYDATFNLAAAGLWRLKASIVNVVQWLVRISADFDLTALPAVNAFATAATAAMAVIGNAIDAFSKFQEYDATFNLAAAGLGRLKASIVNCVQWIIRMGEEMSVSGLAGAVAFAAAADAVMTMIGNAIDAFTALQGFEGVTLAAVISFGEAMGTVVAVMAAIGSTFSTDGLAAATAFATAAGTIGGSIEAAVNGLKLLMEFSGAISWDAMHQFQVAIWTMVAGLREVARGFDAEGLAAAQAFATAAGTIGGSIETALRGIQALLAYAGGNITAAMALFVADIQAVVVALGAANDDLQTGVMAATTFLALTNAMLASITSAATALTTGLSSAGTAISTAAATWLEHITAMDASLGGAQNILQTTALPAALQVATLGAVIGAAILAGANAAAAGANAGATGVPGAMAIILASVVTAVAALEAQFAILNAAAWHFGNDWVSNIIAGLNSRLGDLETLLAYIRGLFPSSPAKYGPFKTLPDGQAVGEGFATGLTDGLLGGQARLVDALGFMRGTMGMSGMSGTMGMSGIGGLQPAYAGGGTTHNTINFSGPINVRDDRDIERLANAIGNELARQADLQRRTGYRL